MGRSLACLEKGLASQKKKALPALSTLVKDGAGVLRFINSVFAAPPARGVHASAAAADAGSVPVCVLHDGAVPEPFVDALSDTGDARRGVRRSARPEACGYPAPVFAFLGWATRKSPPIRRYYSKPLSRCACPDASQAKRARRALTLAKYANTSEPPPPKRARVRAHFEGQAGADRLDALLRGARAPLAANLDASGAGAGARAGAS